MNSEARFAVCFAVVALGLVAAPMLTQRDSFPLSNYPMFARPKPDKVRVTHLVAFTERGARWIVPPGVLGTGEVLQARALLQRTASRGEAASSALCARVASEIAQRGVEPLSAPLVRLALRSDTFDVEAYFVSAQPDAEASVLHAECEVPR